MNILYCGDAGILDGLIISILSIMKNTDSQLHIYVLTMQYQNYQPLKYKDVKRLEEILKSKNKNNFLKIIDITKTVQKCLPIANMDTMFTPYCMLRLYADEIKEIPDKVIYLDNDVVCLKNPQSFYDIDNTNYELVGVLDYYGSHFYKKKPFKKDYINSGVLLLNLKLIRETKLFLKCRKLVRDKKMLLPDQAALNKYCQSKLIVPRHFNEQKQIKAKTVFRHFSTTFKFWPYIHTQTIKPWHIEKLHDVLKVHCFDDILEKYKILRKEKENEENNSHIFDN